MPGKGAPADQFLGTLDYVTTGNAEGGRDYDAKTVHFALGTSHALNWSGR